MIDFLAALYSVIKIGFILFFSFFAVPLLYLSYIVGTASILLALFGVYRLLRNKETSRRLGVLIFFCAFTSVVILFCFRVIFGSPK
jgi:hypothetical protein